MLVWWFIGSIGCLFVGIIHCQGDNVKLVDLDPSQDEVNVGLSIDDTPPETITNDTNNLPDNEVIVTTTNSTTTQTPEPFSCHECINCKSKSDLATVVCQPGIKMCYKMHKRIGNVSQVIRRGCSTSKIQCTVPDDDQSSSLESITCCTSHKCNEATQFKPLFFLSTLGLFTILISIINT